MRHAYFILAHDYPYNLKVLLSLLDHERNTIYIHIDKKSTTLDCEEIKKWCSISKIIFLRREKVMWGGYSLIDCEFRFLRESVKGKYDYYHFISGQDLPLVSQDKMNEFFEKNAGFEFVSLYKKEDIQWRVQELYKRICYWHLEELSLCFEKKIMQKIVIIFAKICLKLQEILNITRNISIEDISFGKNWFSITHDFALYVLEQQKEIEKKFSFTSCADEIFLQYIIQNSPYKEKIYQSNKDASLRFVDWNRGKPYIWELQDFDELVHSGYIFARKFSENKDRLIIDAIYNYIKEQEKSIGHEG